MEREIPKSHYELTGRLGKTIEVLTMTKEGWRYRYTTKWHKTCRAAKERYCLAYGFNPSRVKCRIVKESI
jgi:hypothetical protein